MSPPFICGFIGGVFALSAVMNLAEGDMLRTFAAALVTAICFALVWIGTRQ
ncbi:hypothetical protein [Limimaricola cinnabarinus]|uniref:hypothetical protein n=1 Tax=Limimaricola cinnabarinus TaxID=1125964 RepID=UPI0024907494|nr:hypothetical protein [Limimaricola cinnabarinus]